MRFITVRTAKVSYCLETSPSLKPNEHIFA